MKIISWNVNGLRSAEPYLLEFIGRENPDIILLQEIKTYPEQLSSRLRNLQGYQAFFNSAQKKGYAGVAIYTKKKPILIEKTLGLARFDQEGRILKIDYPNFSLINVYLPHGGRQKENLKYKLQAYSMLFECLSPMQSKKVILIGDFNIAHKEIDLARPKQNKNNIMFTLSERRQIDKLIELGFVDTFRLFHQESGYYSWFPYGFSARERNLGWRIDYAFIPSKLKSRVRNTSILKGVDGSDHCPVLLEIDL